MKELSIIVPFAGEYPQAIFTVQALAQSLLGKLDFEIIVVDNYCKELETQWDKAKQGALKKAEAISRQMLIDDDQEVDIIGQIVAMVPNMSNKSAEAFKASERGNEWLRYMKFDGRLSHWECKRLAVEAAESDTFLFVDAHTVPSSGIDIMYRDYIDMGYSKEGTFHMPLTYKILEWHRLIYKMVVEHSFYGYSFTGMKEDEKDPFEVPVMSCCGVMISREVLEKIGGWPHHMHAYGGGENFLNYSLAVTGMKKFIYPGVTLHHHGEKRDYHYTYDGTLINRLTAHFLFGGMEALTDLAAASRGNAQTLKRMVDSIASNPDHIAHRKIIKENSVLTLGEFVESWEG